MELVVVFVTTLCISLSLMLTPTVSHVIEVHPSSNLVQDLRRVVPRLTLPRKLKLNDDHQEETAVLVKEVEINGDSSTSYYKLKGSSPGKQHHASGGTHQALGGSSDVAEFFTMDYSHVRRRRPIHNKFVPKNLVSVP